MPTLNSPPEYEELPPSYQGGIDVRVTSIPVDNDNADVMISLVPPETTDRVPVDICCVIDVSGSMGSEATIGTEEGGKEGHGLTLLDVVSHSMKTIINSLKPEDRLTIVTYSNTASVILPLVAMDVGGKRRAEAAVGEMDPDGNTNTWMGLFTGLEELKNNSAADRLAALLLLTDGQPNIEPPRGHLPMLRRYRDSNGGRFPCIINTFGFGYDLNSKLLREMAIEGGGTYAFIPDSNFVGTTFAHSLANLCATVGTEASLTIEPADGVRIVEGGVFGAHTTNPCPPDGVVINLTTLQAGQTVDVVVRTTRPADGADVICGRLAYTCKGSAAVQDFVGKMGEGAASPLEVDAQKNRLQFTAVVARAHDVKRAGLPEARAMVEALITEISSSPSAASPCVAGLLEDLRGQVTEALSREDWFDKWGQHYLPSLARAHLLQQCNNFKDPGVQFYGGPLFAEVRDLVDDIFVALPPPTPSLAFMYEAQHSSDFRDNRGRRAAPAPVVDMSMYNNRYGGCFAGTCKVTMADGSLVQCSNIKKGDLVQAPSGKAVPVRCVVRTKTAGGAAQLVELPGGLLATPWHPVRVPAASEWVFPCEVGRAKEVRCPYIYCFLLGAGADPDDHGVEVDGTPAVTLASGATAGVREHPYWGTERVVADLARLKGWAEGRVDLEAGKCVVRDRRTGEVCGLTQ